MHGQRSPLYMFEITIQPVDLSETRFQTERWWPTQYHRFLYSHVFFQTTFATSTFFSRVNAWMVYLKNYHDQRFEGKFTKQPTLIFFPNQACNQQLGVWTTVSLNAAQWAAGVHGFLCCHHFLYDIVWKQFSGTHAVLQGDFAFISSHRRKNMFRHHSCQKGWLVLLLYSISDCVACDMVAEFDYVLLTAALWVTGSS